MSWINKSMVNLQSQTWFYNYVIKHFIKSIEKINSLWNYIFYLMIFSMCVDLEVWLAFFKEQYFWSIDHISQKQTIHVFFFNYQVGGSMVKFWDQGFCSSVISDSSPVVVNIDSHWRLSWLLTSGSVGISRSVYKLVRTLPCE